MPNSASTRPQFKELPRNIYSFSSARAKRDLRARTNGASNDSPNAASNRSAHSKSRTSESESADTATAAATFDQQIELFEQQNLFISDFDVIEELNDNKSKYLTFADNREQISIYRVPSVVSYNIDRIKRRLQDKSGIHPIYSCCASYGIAQLYKNPHVRDLADLRDLLLEDHIVNSGRDVIEFYDLLRSFKIEIPDDSGGLASENKTNVLVPEWLAQSLGGLASKLGAPKASLLVIATMYTLAMQASTIEPHQKQLNYSVDTFLRRVEFRKRIASVLLEML